MQSHHKQEISSWFCSELLTFIKNKIFSKYFFLFSMIDFVINYFQPKMCEYFAFGLKIISSVQESINAWLEVWIDH